MVIKINVFLLVKYLSLWYYSNKKQKGNMSMNWRRAIPFVSYVCAGLGVIALFVHLMCRFHMPFADFINRYPAAWLRALMGYATGWFPLSFAELLVVCIPLWIFLLVLFVIRHSVSRERMVRAVSILLAAVMGGYSLFVFTLGCGYFATPLDRKLDLAEEEISAEELYETALWLIGETNANASGHETEESGSTRMPISIEKMNEHLLDAYASLAEECDFLSVAYSRVKPVVLSKPMSYSNITGVYFFLTGEANINVNYPDYTVPFTAAHELAHQRGIARENEANFIAFLACIRSNEAYIRYSAYANVMEFVMNALYRADKTLWEAAWGKISEEVRKEIHAYNEFYQSYQHTVIDEISSALNDSYLKGNGTEGTVSYGLVVNLAVAYYHNLKKDT